MLTQNERSPLQPPPPPRLGPPSRHPPLTARAAAPPAVEPLAAAAAPRLQLAAAANHTVGSRRRGSACRTASRRGWWTGRALTWARCPPCRSPPRDAVAHEAIAAVSEDTLSVFVGDFDAGTIVQADIATGVVTRTLDAPSPGLLARSADGRSLWNTGVLSGKLRRLSLETGETSLTVGGGGGFADGNASAAQFDHPLGVALGVKAGEDVLYVADSGNRPHPPRRRGDGRGGDVAGSARGRRDGDADAAQFASPYGVAAGADGWSLYVTDEENDAVRAIDLTSRRVTTLAGAAAAGDGSRGFADGSFEAARFNKPAGIAATKDGKLLIVADAGNHAIRLLDLEKRVVTTIAGDGAAGAGAFADGNASAARFNRPTGVGARADGHLLYVADAINDQVRQVIVRMPATLVAKAAPPRSSRARRRTQRCRRPRSTQRRLRRVALAVALAAAGDECGGEPGAAPAAQAQGQQGFQEQDALAEAEALRGGNGGAMSGGAIAAVVGGALLLIVLIVLCLCTLWDVLRLRRGAVQRCCCCRARATRGTRRRPTRGRMSSGLNVCLNRVSKIALVLSLHSDDEEHRVVLLLRAGHRRHRGAGRHGKVALPRKCRGAARVARRPARQMRDVVQLAAVERPLTVVDREHRRRLAAARDQVATARHREVGRLHDEPVLLEPPVVFIELPSGFGNAAARLEALEIPEHYAARTRIDGPQAPLFRTFAGRGTRVSWPAMN